MQISTHHVIRFIERVASIIKDHREELTELDSPIGDADHGINLDRGFTSVLGKLPTVEDKDIGTLLKTTGMTLISTVGGASGPLYGTAFMRASSILSDRYEISEVELINALEAALEGIKARGKAQRNEKTMIDSIEPGVELLKQQHESGEAFLDVLRRAVGAVEEGMQATIPMQATKGRASYLGERSIGHQDPGATSAFYIAQALLATFEEASSEH